MKETILGWIIAAIISILFLCIFSVEYFMSCYSYEKSGKVAEHKLGQTALVICECNNGKIRVKDSYSNEISWDKNEIRSIEE